jgi:hypothetical protein
LNSFFAGAISALTKKKKKLEVKFVFGERASAPGHLSSLAFLSMQAYFGNYFGGSWWEQYRSPFWLPTHLDYFTVKHRRHWSAENEDSESHQQADADEV